MTFLPVVERELRVSARRWWTHWGRVTYAAIFLAIAAMFFAAEYRSWKSPVRLSQELFLVMSVTGWFAALLIGALATADAITSEKRDGTLGLLFLTDLRGYDIVFGKLAGCGVNAAFGLFAALPLLALPLLMGGVQARQFFQTEAVILLGLIYAMSAGLMVSTLVRSARKAYVLTLLLLAFLTIGVIALELFWMELTRRRSAGPELSVISPFVGLIASRILRLLASPH